MKAYFLWLAKLLTLIAIVFFVIPFLLIAAIVASQTGLDEMKDRSKVVAVIELTGIIESSKDILKELHKQAESKDVKGIVLSINSPGGAVGPSQDIYDAVKKLKAKKPIVASMGTVAASGGLYSALGASKIYAQPGTLTGSIGVIMQVPNFKKVTDWIGVDMITIKSGQLKDVGNSFREMTPEEKDFLEKTVAKVHESFVQAVVDGRGIPKEKVLQFADGRVILGSQAKDLALIDAYGDVYEASRAVFELINQPLKEDESPTLFYPADKFGEFKKVLGSVSKLTGTFERSMEMKYLMY